MKNLYPLILTIFLLLLMSGCSKKPESISQKPISILGKPAMEESYLPWRHPAVKGEKDNPGLHSYDPWRHPASKSGPPS